LEAIFALQAAPGGFCTSGQLPALAPGALEITDLYVLISKYHF
jgi:hypothetical protein